MFSLSLLFLALPLYFSHVFMHFGVIMGDGVSFERQKMYLFFCVVFVAVIEMILLRYDSCISVIKKYGYIFLGLMALPLIPIGLYNMSVDEYWVRGSYEKFHGYILYIGIIMLSFCLLLISRSERLRLIWISFFSLGIVSVIAILEGFGVSVFFPPQGGVWGSGIRAISTLGNPNYLAGYLLMMFPLVIGFMRGHMRWILALLTIGALWATKSYIGMIIMVGYLVVLYLIWFQKKYHLSQYFTWIGLTFIGFIGGIIGYFFISGDKFLSLAGRFVLMDEIGTNMIQYPLIFILGAGPESVLRFFSESRTERVDMYFPHDSIIDSSHNIILDCVFQYGFVFVAFIVYILYRNWHIWNPYARTAAILGIMFLVFNPYVVIHSVLLTFLCTFYDKK